MMIEPGRAIVVLVLSPGVVHDRLIRIPSLIDEKDLNEIGQADRALPHGQATQ